MYTGNLCFFKKNAVFNIAVYGPYKLHIPIYAMFMECSNTPEVICECVATYVSVIAIVMLWRKVKRTQLRPLTEKDQKSPNGPKMVCTVQDT